jgi:hypothetical protein
MMLLARKWPHKPYIFTFRSPVHTGLRLLPWPLIACLFRPDLEVPYE